MKRILEFITFYQNALRHEQLKYSVVESVHRSFTAQTQGFFVANFLQHGQRS